MKRTIIEDKTKEIIKGLLEAKPADSDECFNNIDDLKDLIKLLNNKSLCLLLNRCIAASQKLNIPIFTETQITEVDIAEQFSRLKDEFLRRRYKDVEKKYEDDVYKKVSNEEYEKNLKIICNNFIIDENLGNYIQEKKDNQHSSATDIVECLLGVLEKKDREKPTKVSDDEDVQNEYLKRNYGNYFDDIQEIKNLLKNDFLISRFLEILYANKEGLVSNRDKDVEDKKDYYRLFSDKTFWKSPSMNYKIIPSLKNYIKACQLFNNNEKYMQVILSFIYNNAYDAISFCNRYSTKDENKVIEKLFLKKYVKDFNGKNFADSLPKYWNPKRRPQFSDKIEIRKYKGKEIYRNNKVWKYLETGDPISDDFIETNSKNTDEKMSSESIIFLQSEKNTDQYESYTDILKFDEKVENMDEFDKLNWKKLKKEFIEHLDGEKNYVILFDKTKYNNLSKEKKYSDKKLELCTVIKKRDDENHPNCDMGHKPNHEYFLMHAIYMLSNKLGTTNKEKDEAFEKIYETPDFYEIQSKGYNRGQIGDKEISIKEIIDDYISGNKTIEGLDEYIEPENSTEETK